MILIHLKPMPISEARKLKVGNKVYICYAKDDDDNDVRVDGVETVSEISNNLILAGEWWDLNDKKWFNDKQRKEHAESNEVFTARGSAYLFYPHYLSI